MARDDQPIRLAEEPPFRLQRLTVTPSTRQVAWADEMRTLEPRVMQVLAALRRANGAVVGRDELIRRCWDGRIVGDNAINRVIFMLRQLGAETGAFSLVTVTKVGYRLAETPDTGAVGPPPDRIRRGGRGLALGGGVLALLVVGALAWLWLERSGESRGAQNGRVEVARIEARQREPELVRLSATVEDSLAQVLTRSGIDTIPETAGRGRNAAELRVTGSVDRQGPDLVVSTQVLDRKSGLVLASLQFTRPAVAARGLAEQAALGVAAGLACALSDRKVSRSAISPSVFSLYLNTCDAVAREGNPQRMLESARRLVSAAPDLAGGHALYGIAQGNAANGYPPAEADALRRGARQSAARALQLDPKTAKAYIAIANSYRAGGDWIERERNYLKAREIDPNLNPGRVSHIGLMREVGRLKEAQEMTDQVMASGDPRTLSNAMIPAIFLNAQGGDMGRALKLLSELERSDPERAGGVSWMLASTWEDPEPALARLRAMGPHGDYSPRTFACVERFLQELQGRRASGARGLPPACDGVSGERRIQLLAREGDLDGAYAEAARTFVDPSDAYVGLLFYPTMQAFRADPRFIPLTKRLGLFDYWSRSGHWPDFCGEQDLPYDCRPSVRAETPRNAM